MFTHTIYNYGVYFVVGPRLSAVKHVEWSRSGIFIVRICFADEVERGADPVRRNVFLLSCSPNAHFHPYI